MIQIRALLDVDVFGTIATMGCRGWQGEKGTNGTSFVRSGVPTSGGDGGAGGPPYPNYELADNRGLRGAGGTDSQASNRPGSKAGNGGFGGLGGSGAGGSVRLRGLRSVRVIGAVNATSKAGAAFHGVIFIQGFQAETPGTLLGRVSVATGVPGVGQPYAAPVISPASGTYSNPITVNITAEPGAIVHYTTNGSTPNENSPRYTDSFQLSQPTSVQAFAYGPNRSPSGAARADYAFRVIAPTVLRSPPPDPPTGLYSAGPVTVTYTHPGVSVGVVVRYTTNGLAVSESSAVAPTTLVGERNMNLR